MMRIYEFLTHRPTLLIRSERGRWLDKGFTVVELLLVIGIFLIVSSLSIPLYNNWQSRVTLLSVQAELLQSLREARVLSQGGRGQSRHGIYFDSGNNNYTVYRGDDYAGRGTGYDRLINLESNISLALDWGGEEVNFATSTGVPSATGTISIINSANNEFKTIVINRYGIIKE